MCPARSLVAVDSEVLPSTAVKGPGITSTADWRGLRILYVRQPSIGEGLPFTILTVRRERAPSVPTGPVMVARRLDTQAPLSLSI